MAEETPDKPEEKPKRRRRRRKADEEVSEVTSPSEETASTASEDDVTPEAQAPDAEAEPPTSEAPEPEPASAAEEEGQEPEAASEAEEPEAASEPEPAAAPRRRRRAAPTRRRDRPEPVPGPPVVVRAQAKYVRSSARKARLVCDHIRGKSVEDARAILAHAPRAVARDWSKLLESAVANAEHNHELVGEDLYVKAVQADEGPTIKRYRPRALGRATRIRKRTSHLTILLTPKD